MIKKRRTFSYHSNFEKKLDKYRRKDKKLYLRIMDLVNEIYKDPEKGEMKRHDLKGIRGIHIESYVLAYKYYLQIDEVYFIECDKHNPAYAFLKKLVKKGEIE